MTHIKLSPMSPGRTSIDRYEDFRTTLVSMLRSYGIRVVSPQRASARLIFSDRQQRQRISAVGDDVKSREYVLFSEVSFSVLSGEESSSILLPSQTVLEQASYLADPDRPLLDESERSAVTKDIEHVQADRSAAENDRVVEADNLRGYKAGCFFSSSGPMSGGRSPRRMPSWQASTPGLETTASTGTALESARSQTADRRLAPRLQPATPAVIIGFMKHLAAVFSILFLPVTLESFEGLEDPFSGVNPLAALFCDSNDMADCSFPTEPVEKELRYSTVVCVRTS